ncbi:hypothetical protein [Agarivorans gilvus]|uniref:Outer membrane protein beta-barrel domain-containing protein n=1 Tax=Agarivorans gilvus TaxID=680279 RepID=A0ABQ1I0P7_9ALTE|nr:hypothetical protein [Agarivorans gilvus]GGB00958.1 hypothetical protein GCM10007414_12630 [Agarivorans gilvus]
MKKILIGLPMLLLAGTAMAEQSVNYGDPTAQFTMGGVSRSSDRTQLNGVVGWGEGNMVFVDLGLGDKRTAEDKLDYDYRLRYFKVNDGLGYSLDVVGNADSTTTLAGGMYKFQLSDKVSVFPMLYGGYLDSKHAIEVEGRDSFKNSAIAQAGLYAMYAFDGGHWLYANPKASYVARAKEFVPQLEVGAGYMLSENSSLGLKLEHTVENKISDKDTVGWISFSYYF